MLFICSKMKKKKKEGEKNVRRKRGTNSLLIATPVEYACRIIVTITFSSFPTTTATTTTRVSSRMGVFRYRYRSGKQPTWLLNRTGATSLAGERSMLLNERENVDEKRKPPRLSSLVPASRSGVIPPRRISSLRPGK